MRASQPPDLGEVYERVMAETPVSGQVAAQ